MGYQEHYDTLLAEHYNWMFRIPFDQKVSEQKELLVRSGISKGTSAVDLGAGSGFQSFALLEI